MSTSQLFAMMTGQVWQVTILCVVARWLSKTVLRNQPALAYQLWILVMLKSVTPPLWASHCGVFSWLFHELTAACVAGLEIGLRTPVTLEHLALVAGAVWMAGMLASLVSVGVKWMRIKEQLRSNAIDTPASIHDLTTKLASHLGIRRTIEIVMTSKPIGPAVVGTWRPLIVLPEAILSGRSAADIEPILSHELMHVKRGDTAVALLETFVRAIWWFHPAVLQAADAMSQVGELCCDKDVLDKLQYAPRRYANSLIHVIESKSQLLPLVGQPGIRQQQVTRDRLKRIMTMDTARPRWQLHLGLLLLGILVILPGRSLA